MIRPPPTLRFLTLALSLLSTPALAQDLPSPFDDGAGLLPGDPGPAEAPAPTPDPAAQIAGALTAFLLPGAPGRSREELAGDAAILGLLPSLEGTWAPAHLLFSDPDIFSDDRLAQACDRVGIHLQRTAERSFVLLRKGGSHRNAPPLPIRHDWIGASGFDRSVAEADLVAHLGLGDLAEVHPSLLAPPGLRGEVAMFHPSPDILVFVAPGEPPEILVRCP